MNKKQKKNLIRIIVSAALLIVLHFLFENLGSGMGGEPGGAAAILSNKWFRFALYMIPYLIVGYDILIKAGKGIKNKQPLDECLLMVIATLGAIVIALIDTGDYVEAVAVMLFYQIGEWFQSYAIGRSRKNISELMDIRPDYANIRDEEGHLVQVDPDEIEIGSIIICQPGEKIPIDGIIVSGRSSLDTAALTGESRPRSANIGDEVISGCINMTGVLEIRTTKEFGESTVSKILDLVENASSRKSKSEDFISRFARVYTPVVVGLAVALALVPPVVRMVMGDAPIWGTWLYRALIFLVISCPCALVISIPLSFFGGIGGASREGILIKGSNYLELLSNAHTIVCDKTGTLPEGVFRVTGIYPVSPEGEADNNAVIDEDKLLEYAALSESASSHPIAKSLIKEYANRISQSKDSLETRESRTSDSLEEHAEWLIDENRVKDIEEISGRGIRASIDGCDVAVGNKKLMNEVGAVLPENEDALPIGTIIHVALSGKYAGYIVISDVIKETAQSAIGDLKASGVNRIVMLTGDRKEVAEKVASDLGISEVYSELLPGDKVTNLERIMGIKEGESGAADPSNVVCFVGDGVNDAPVLSRADIGIAMGAMGSDAAIEAADVVLMDDDPKKIAKAIRISKKCLRIVKENIVFAIGVKILCLILGALGIAGMWLAIFADVGVMVIAVLNALRVLFVKNL